MLILSHLGRATSRNSHRSGGHSSARSSSSRHGKAMSSILDIDHRSRKDRTFIGGECAVCEEQLELTLRGERILQLSCGHIAHEACFYEYLREFDSHACPICNAPLSLDSSRGGSVPNIGMSFAPRIGHSDCVDILSTAVRQEASMKQNAYPPSQMVGIGTTSPTPWDDRPVMDTMSQPMGPRGPEPTIQRNRSIGRTSERLGPMVGDIRHGRNGSNGTNALSAQDYADPAQSVIGRRHDYDVQSMEASLRSPRGPAFNQIPSPIVTVRSEFPTLTRSRQQQSLTCLITVEVNEPAWRNEPPQNMGGMATSGAGSEYGAFRSPPLQNMARNEDGELESPEDLERVTKELHNRVENWVGLDLTR